MLFDSKEQQANVIRCIHITAASLIHDASDQHLADLAVLVKLRKDAETGVVAGEAVPPPAGGEHG